jgi:2'-5' RNA ligase
MTRGATARLFVAVDPPAAVCEELEAWARLAAAAVRADELDDLHHRPAGPRAVRVLAPELLHVTLCFLGARPASELPALAAAVEACAGGIGELSIGAPLWLPPRRPRALAVEIADPDGRLAELHAELSRALAGASSWEPERRRFRAHLTVARVRGRARVGGADGLPPTPDARFTPGSLTLYRSHLSPAGAAYEAVASWTLVPGG